MRDEANWKSGEAFRREIGNFDNSILLWSALGGLALVLLVALLTSIGPPVLTEGSIYP